MDTWCDASVSGTLSARDSLFVTAGGASASTFARRSPRGIFSVSSTRRSASFAKGKRSKRVRRGGGYPL